MVLRAQGNLRRYILFETRLLLLLLLLLLLQIDPLIDSNNVQTLLVTAPPRRCYSQCKVPGAVGTQGLLLLHEHLQDESGKYAISWTQEIRIYI